MKTASFARRLVACVLTAGCAALLPAHAQPGAQPAPAGSRPIPGQYIITFSSQVADTLGLTQALLQAHNGRLLHAYARAMKGFSAALPDWAVQALRNHPLVASIEPDQVVSVQQLASPQGQATWGLDRTDQAALPLDSQYHFTHHGAGVYAFIVDSGVRSTHVDFAGRVASGFSVVDDGLGVEDCSGHGTHVAGTVAGSTWGVAKQATLVPVRVFDCNGSGTLSGVIAAVDWVANSPLRPAVANLSLGSSHSPSLNAAVAGAVSKGVSMVVSAGNSDADACTRSPASEPTAITVAASASSDTRAWFSNWGACVDLFAPGVDITSASHEHDSASRLSSGTSMAAPHASGAVALVLQARPTATPAAVADILRQSATAGVIATAGTGTPNLLLNALAASANAANPPQTVAFAAITGRSSVVDTRWRATVTVTVRDVNTGAPVRYAVASGSFSAGGTAQCTTGKTGSCSMNKTYKQSQASVTFTASGISGTRLQYDPSQNSASQVVIARP